MVEGFGGDAVLLQETEGKEVAAAADVGIGVDALAGGGFGGGELAEEEVGGGEVGGDVAGLRVKGESVGEMLDGVGGAVGDEFEGAEVGEGFVEVGVEGDGGLEFVEGGKLLALAEEFFGFGGEFAGGLGDLVLEAAEGDGAGVAGSSGGQVDEELGLEVGLDFAGIEEAADQIGNAEFVEAERDGAEGEAAGGGDDGLGAELAGVDVDEFDAELGHVLFGGAGDDAGEGDAGG